MVNALLIFPIWNDLGKYHIWCVLMLCHKNRCGRHLLWTTVMFPQWWSHGFEVSREQKSKSWSRSWIKSLIHTNAWTTYRTNVAAMMLNYWQVWNDTTYYLLQFSKSPLAWLMQFSHRQMLVAYKVRIYYTSATPVYTPVVLEKWQPHCRTH